MCISGLNLLEASIDNMTTIGFAVPKAIEESLAANDGKYVLQVH